MFLFYLITKPVSGLLQIFPLYYSFKALRAGHSAELNHWVMYWMIQCAISMFESVAEFIVGWLPFYYEVKLLLTVWMILPESKLVTILYTQSLVHILEQNEEHFDKLSSHGTRTFLVLLQKSAGLLLSLMQGHINHSVEEGSDKTL